MVKLCFGTLKRVRQQNCRPEQHTTLGQPEVGSMKKEKAELLALQSIPERLRSDYIIQQERTEHKPYGYVIYGCSRKYLETGDRNYLLYGNGPIVVLGNGKVCRLGSSPSNSDRIKEFEEDLYATSAFYRLRRFLCSLSSIEMTTPFSGKPSKRRGK